MSMRAWQVFQHGEPAEVLQFGADVDLPKPVGEQVQLQVEACAVNFADSLLCRGTYQDKPPLPFTPGLELAGVVVATGPEAHHAIGARVLGSALLPHGGFAEQALARSHDVFPVMADLPSVEAAAFHVTYQTSWFALCRRAHLAPGETLVVHAGAGGVGSAAVQLGRAVGAHVIATAGGEAKVAQCLEHGAHVAIDYELEDFVAAVNDLTNGRGADVVFDPVGGDTFLRSTKCIAWEGRIVVIGAAGGNYAEARTNHALVKNYSVLGLNWGGYRVHHPELVAEAHDDLMALYEHGALRPQVSEVAPLDALPDALARLTGRQTTGKVVLRP
jgi:NADPH2:quinone reductase